ncbi:MAG: hypothetical protein DI626_11305, partial [Micavibrio aeruginosavorus]
MIDQNTFNPRSMTKEQGFLKSQSGDFYTRMGTKYYHVPSDVFRERIRKDKVCVFIAAAAIAFLTFKFNNARLWGSSGDATLFLYGGLSVALFVFFAGRKFVTRHLDFVYQESWMEWAESHAKRFALLFLLFAAVVELFCGFYFIRVIMVPAYKSYDYYRTKNAHVQVESAQPYNPPAPQEPSAEYLQWMKDNNITVGQLDVFAKDLGDFVDKERAHSLFMEKDSL